MKVIAINGSPRKKWNTAIMLEKALEGSASKGAETELIHLYELGYKGCMSCFACKTKGGKSYGSCAVKDDLAPILKKIKEVDAVILGSPMYFGSVSGEMRSFMERLLFPFLRYSGPPRSLFPKKMNTGFIYTMNCPEERIKDVGYDKYFADNERVLKMIFGGTTETLLSCETYQFDDYSKVVSDMFDSERKANRRKEIFPKDCEKAFDLGVRIVKAGD